MDRSLDDITEDDFQGQSDLDGDKDDFDDIVFSQDFEGPGDADYPTSNKKRRIDDHLPNDLTDDDLEPNTVRPGDEQHPMDHGDEVSNNGEEDATVDHYPLDDPLPHLESLGTQMPRSPAMASDAKGSPPHSYAPGGFLGPPFFTQNMNFGPVGAPGPSSDLPPQEGSGTGTSTYFPPLPATQASFNEMKNTLMSGCPNFEGGNGITTEENSAEEIGDPIAQGAATGDQKSDRNTDGDLPSEEPPTSDAVEQQHDGPVSPPSPASDQPGSAAPPLPFGPTPGAHVQQPFIYPSQMPLGPASLFARGFPWGNPMFPPQLVPNFHMNTMQQLPFGVPGAPQAAVPNQSNGNLPFSIPAQQQKYAEAIVCARPGTKIEPSKGIPVSSSYDTQELTEYQALIRQQFEFFEATLDDVQENVQGRRKKLSVGQVGMRCKHCTLQPLRHRGKSSVYFPSYLGGVYQAAQNMAKTHLCESCDAMPIILKERIRYLQKQGGLGKIGKLYWVEGCRFIGLVETADKKLRFKWSSIKSPPDEEEKEG